MQFLKFLVLAQHARLSQLPPLRDSQAKWLGISSSLVVGFHTLKFKKKRKTTFKGVYNSKQVLNSIVQSPDASVALKGAVNLGAALLSLGSWQFLDFCTFEIDSMLCAALEQKQATTMFFQISVAHFKHSSESGHLCKSKGKEKQIQ